MLVIKKIICTILISTLLIGLAPADTLMYSHVSDEKLTEEIKKINKELNDYKKNKMVSQNNISRKGKIIIIIFSIMYYILVGLVFSNLAVPTLLVVLLSVIVWSTIIAMSQIEHITKKLELINKNITHLEKRATILEYVSNERPSHPYGIHFVVDPVFIEMERTYLRIDMILTRKTQSFNIYHFIHKEFFKEKFFSTVPKEMDAQAPLQFLHKKFRKLILAVIKGYGCFPQWNGKEKNLVNELFLTIIALAVDAFFNKIRNSELTKICHRDFTLQYDLKLLKYLKQAV